MAKVTADEMFQIYYIPSLFFGSVCVTSRYLLPSYILSCPTAKCCFSCVLGTKDSIFNVQTSHDVSRLSSCWFWSRNMLYTAVIKLYSKRCFRILSLLSGVSFPLFLHCFVSDTVQHGDMSGLAEILPIRKSSLVNCSQATNSRNTGQHLVECCTIRLYEYVSTLS
jgi:hypothetical protein